MTQLAFYILSDIHGYIFPTDFKQTKGYKPIGLLLANHIIEQDRQRYDASFKIDNGDFLQGSPFCHYLATHIHSSKPLTDIYNRIGFDFGTLGNHEFNYGLNYLTQSINRLNYPILCANILKDNKSLTEQGIMYIKKQGYNIGIIGLTTQYIPHWERPEYIQHLTFNSAVQTLEDILPQVREQADIVVVSYHGGFERNIDTYQPTEVLTGENEASEILQRFGSDIDVLITGHQHREIAAIKHDTVILQPGTRATQIGKVTLTFNDRRQLVQRTSELLPVHDDSAFKLTDKDSQLMSDVDTWLDTPIAEIQQNMIVDEPFTARIAPHPFINVLLHALLQTSGAQIASTALFDSATGFDKTITMRDIINNYPFPNTFKVLEMTGKGIREALEQSARYFDLTDSGDVGINDTFLNPKPQHYNYDIFGGVSYNIKVSEPMGHRVHDIKGEGQPLVEDKIYTVCVNNYRAVGGGDYNMFAEAKVVKDIQVEGAQLLIDYLTHHNLNNMPQVVDFKVEI